MLSGKVPRYPRGCSCIFTSRCLRHATSHHFAGRRGSLWAEGRVLRCCGAAGVQAVGGSGRREERKGDRRVVGSPGLGRRHGVGGVLAAAVAAPLCLPPSLVGFLFCQMSSCSLTRLVRRRFGLLVLLPTSMLCPGLVRSGQPATSCRPNNEAPCHDAVRACGTCVEGRLHGSSRSQYLSSCGRSCGRSGRMLNHASLTCCRPTNTPLVLAGGDRCGHNRSLCQRQTGMRRRTGISTRTGMRRQR